MKENIKLGLILFIITAFAGLCLGFANELTASAIAENSKINSGVLAQLLPGAVKVKDIKIEKIDEEVKIKVTEAYEAHSGDALIGYVYKVTTKGFHGSVDMLVAINKEDKLSGIEVVYHTETPGLGARIVEDGFRQGFVGREIINGISMVKLEAAKDNEVQAITGATVSSKAVGTGVNTAVAFYMETIKGIKADFNNKDATSGASESAEEGATTESPADATSGATQQ